MALVKTDNSIVSIHGKLGGVYFKTGKDGIHCQASPRHVLYPHPPPQSPGIGAFTKASWMWLLILLAFYAAKWAAFAAKWTYDEVSGEHRRLNAYQWYIHYAITPGPIDSTPLWKPPEDPWILPHYVVTYKGMFTYQHDVTQWPIVSPAGYYWYAHEYNLQPAYRDDTDQWWLWWEAPYWYISPALGIKHPDMTYISRDNIIKNIYTNPTTHEHSMVFWGRQWMEKRAQQLVEAGIFVETDLTR